MGFKIFFVIADTAFFPERLEILYPGIPFFPDLGGTVFHTQFTFGIAGTEFCQNIQTSYWFPVDFNFFQQR